MNTQKCKLGEHTIHLRALFRKPGPARGGVSPVHQPLRWFVPVLFADTRWRVPIAFGPDFAVMKIDAQRHRILEQAVESQNAKE